MGQIVQSLQASKDPNKMDLANTSNLMAETKYTGQS